MCSWDSCSVLCGIWDSHPHTDPKEQKTQTQMLWWVHYFILTKGSILVCKWQNKSYTYIVSCNIFLSRRDFLFVWGHVFAILQVSFHYSQDGLEIWTEKAIKQRPIRSTSVCCWCKKHFYHSKLASWAYDAQSSQTLAPNNKKLITFWLETLTLQHADSSSGWQPVTPASTGEK